VSLEEPEATPGAVSVRGRPVRRAPLGWLPWAALAAAIVLALVMLVVALTISG
jgi:hypothetical protein